MDCPGRWRSHRPWGCLGIDWVALRAMLWQTGWWSVTGPDDLKGLFQPHWSVFLWLAWAHRGTAVGGMAALLGELTGTEITGAWTRGQGRSSGVSDRQATEFKHDAISETAQHFFLVVTGVFCESWAHASPLTASRRDRLHDGAIRRLPAAFPGRSSEAFPGTRSRPPPSAPLPGRCPRPATPPSASGAPPGGPALPTWSHLYGAGRSRAAGAARRDGRPGRRLQRLPFVSGAARAVGAGGREGARAAELRPSLGSRPQPAAGRGRRRSGPSPASPARGEEGAGSAEGLSGDRREEAGPGCTALWKLGAGGGGGEGPSPAESSRVRSQLEPPRRGLAAPGPTFVAGWPGVASVLRRGPGQRGGARPARAADGPRCSRSPRRESRGPRRRLSRSVRQRGGAARGQRPLPAWDAPPPWAPSSLSVPRPARRARADWHRCLDMFPSQPGAFFDVVKLRGK